MTISASHTCNGEVTGSQPACRGVALVGLLRQLGIHPFNSVVSRHLKAAVDSLLLNIKGLNRPGVINWAELEVPSPADPAEASFYGYNGLDRLSSIDASGSRTQAYRAVSNQLSAGATTDTYDRADRLLADDAHDVLE